MNDRSPQGWRARRGLGLALGFTLLAACGGVSSHDTTMTAAQNATATASAAELPDDFYIPPDPLPAGQPGDIIRSRPSSAGPPRAREMADAWQVMYLSTNAVGEPSAVTGTVLIPTGADPATMPIIGLGPGTHGPAFRCAPSRMINDGIFYEQPALNDMLERGYAVAVPDYDGYHPDPATSYMVGHAMGPAMIDAVRAAQRLPESGLSGDAPVVFRGYSQGGGAAMWAGEYQPSYAPELNLVGVAGGGVPSNLAEVGLPLNGSDGFGFFLYALLGQDNAYPDVSMEPHLNELGQTEVQRMEQEVCVLELIQQFAGGTLADYTSSNPLTPERLTHLAENVLGSSPIEVPVLQYHEPQDGLVAVGQAETLRNNYCSLGVDVDWQPFDTNGETGLIRHINLVYRGNEAVNAFVEARLAGQAPVNNCA